MEYISRTSSLMSEATDLELLFSFKKFPAYMGCVTSPEEDDLYLDMDWFIDQETGFIQLNKLVPLEILYGKYENHSLTVGSIWKRHHSAFASFVYKYRPDTVLELGGAHGILAENIFKIDPTIDWTILEPNPRITSELELQVIKGWFDKDFTIEKDVDCIIHSHVLEHTYDPLKFTRDIHSFLPESGRLIFSVPYLEAWLKDYSLTTLDFEHTFFLTEPYIEFILNRQGFKILEKQIYDDTHSIFYACEKVKGNSQATLNAGLYNHNKKIFMDYANYYRELVIDLNLRLTEVDLEKVYLFGGHVFSQYLIAFGLDISKVVCILDNDTQKQDKRLYGSNLYVRSPRILANEKNPIVIVKCGAYTDEIKSGIETEINSEVVFW